MTALIVIVGLAGLWACLLAWITLTETRAASIVLLPSMQTTSVGTETPEELIPL